MQQRCRIEAALLQDSGPVMLLLLLLLLPRINRMHMTSAVQYAAAAF
jgi:hypothetical protein